MAELKEIDRPLGQDGPPARRGVTLDRGSIMLAAAAVVLVVVSAAIALRDRPFRHPETTAVTTPKIVAEVNPVATEPVRPAPSASGAAKPTDGPKIIHIEGEGPASQPGGAIVIRDPSAVSQDLRVAHLPDRALIEDSPTGPLPIRSVDGRRPFDVYARPWSGARGARIAIVIGGLAVSQTTTQAAIAKLPAEVTLAFAPQGNSIGRWMQDARHRGHEIVMQVPLEPFGYPSVNPGRNTLTIAASPPENLEKLRWALSRMTNYVAVMNYMGARFSSDADALQPVMDELAKRGLGYIDDGTSARSQAPELALKDSVPFAVADTTIDQVQDRGAILKKLDELEATARAKGFAVGVGSAFDVTVDTVASWVEEAKKRGIEIVPISAVANDPQKG
ncbi:divergent polysaccharide deacetylase family protein [Manganibacter manganicus]|uniref:Divergent polysaccharide deacetylase family protein n=1 Tax=Manganibacter manganicus TaxID=1873176 RepID=A0A1V8RNH8_9HYPH|nr:divergent polysaccharide deacetylase family protein [Pseudaminobacter manganicus]OQM74694.1 hypothetical protein BFN67_20800 [Pseudaminobacter manganicus]